MATATQRKIENLLDKVYSLQNKLSDIEYEIGELTEPGEDVSLDGKMTAVIGDGEWEFTKRQAVMAFDLLEQIGLDETRKYNLVQIEQIRLAVEHILG